MFDSDAHEMHAESLRRLDDIAMPESWPPSEEYASRPLPQRATPTARLIALRALRNACRALFTLANARCDQHRRLIIDDADMVHASNALSRALLQAGDQAAQCPEWANALVFSDDFPPPHPYFPAAYPRPPAGYTWTPPA